MQARDTENAGPRATADLETAWTAWGDHAGGGNVANRRSAVRALLRGRPSARVSDLPELTRAMLDHYRETGQTRTGNLYRVRFLGQGGGLTRPPSG